jgi:hypothetical protein
MNNATPTDDGGFGISEAEKAQLLADINKVSKDNE